MIDFLKAEQASPASEQRVERVGPYRLVSVIGAGGQGHVHEAVDERLGRRVALKVLPPGLLRSDAARARFRREAELLSRLDHPGIATVYEAGEADGVPYLALRLLEGESLAQRIARERETRERAGSGRETLEQLLGLLEAVARALHAAHQLGVVHRDVKPGNILIGSQGDPVVIDFGLARDLDSVSESLTRSGDVLGTPAYMAPEQIRGDVRSIDARSDVYALGVVLFECVASRPPFLAPTREALYRMILESDPPDLRGLFPRCPKDLAVVVETCLEKTPARRYQSALYLAEELARVARREPILARRISSVGRLWRWAQRRPTIASLAAATAVLLAVVTAGSLYYALEQKEIAEYRRDLVDERTRLAEEKAAEGARQGDLKREAEERLYSALLGQARGLRTARQPGYRREVFDLLGQAVALSRGPQGEIPAERREAIREEALAAMGDFVGLPSLTAEALDRSSLDPFATDAASRGAPPFPTTGPWAFSPQGKLYAWADQNSRVLHLAQCEDGPDGASWRKLSTATSELWIVRAITFTGAGDRLAAACEGGLLVLDVPDLRPRLAARGPVMGAVACQPNGSLIALLGAHQSVAELWDVDAGRLLTSFAPPPGARRVAFAADGERLVFADAEGTPRGTLQTMNTPERRRLSGGNGGVVDVRFSPDGGRLLACASKDGFLRLWKTETGGILKVLRHVGSDIQSVDFSRDGRHIALGSWSGHVSIHDVDSGALRASADGSSRTGKIWSVRFGLDGRYVVAGGNGGVRLWDVVERAGDLDLVFRSDWAIPGVYALEVTPDGASIPLLLRGPGPPRIEEIQLSSGESRHVRPGDVLSHQFGISLDTSGKLLYFASLDGRLNELNRETGGLRVGLPVGSLVDSFRVFPQGRLVAKGSQGSRVRVAALDPQDLELRPASLELPAEPVDVWCFDLSADGRYLALGLATGETALWDLREVQRIVSSLGVGEPR